VAEVCATVNGNPVNPQPDCGNPATRWLVFGCVHEHLPDGPYCEQCATRWVRQAAKNVLTCRACYQADGHRCQVTVVRDEALPPG